MMKFAICTLNFNSFYLKLLLSQANSSLVFEIVRVDCIDIFLIAQQKHMLWYSLEAPCGGASNEYQTYFCRKIRKMFIQISLLSRVI